MPETSKSKQHELTCPTCGRMFRFAQTDAPPFCGRRCQMVDLGRWFNEEISVPREETGQDPDEHFRDLPV
ncbi:MAG: DNA gyrase inhibitor YacG [Planctomycetota bacterium]